MHDKQTKYRSPPWLETVKGQPRQVGFELEFTGATLEKAGSAVLHATGGKLVTATAAEQLIDVPELGKFKVEVDWEYLKKLAREHREYQNELSLLSDTASLVVPIELVCPPIAIDELGRLDPLVAALREAGAKGTDDSLFAAYGVHVNPEIPEQTPTAIDRYLKAYCLLQSWLVKAHKVNLTRRLTPYVDLYPARYLRRVVAARNPTLDSIIDNYLKYNATRNRALDMLPLFKELQPERIVAELDDARIKARPTFHYRLPNCLIDDADWSLAEAWNRWSIVEELASRSEDLAALCDEFLKRWRLVFGIDESNWIERIERWLRESGLE